MVRAVLLATVAAMIVFWLTAPRTQRTMLQAEYTWLAHSTTGPTTTWYGVNEHGDTARLTLADGKIETWNYTTTRWRNISWWNRWF